MQSTPDFGTDISSDFIHCMGRVGDEFMVLLDVGRVLSLTELSEIMMSVSDPSRRQVS
jgi:purine-binding chemotaxis protein CheW